MVRITPGNNTDKPGKFTVAALKSIVFDRLGVTSPDVLSKPGPGRDFNAIKIGVDDVFLIATDPLYVNPVFGLSEGSWLGFQIIVTDILMSGCCPEFGIFTLSLPNGIARNVFEQIWSIIDSECRRLGIAIVSGHTGSYDGCEFPMLGAGVLLARCKAGGYISLDTLKAGDEIVLAHGPGLEAIASLLRVDSDAGEAVFGTRYESVKAQVWQCLSVEKPVSIARSYLQHTSKDYINPITAMHDVAEKGVLCAVNDWCEATGLGCDLDLDGWPFDPRMKAFIQHYFKNLEDIWRASGQGGVIIGCRPDATQDLLNEFDKNGIVARKIGRMTPNGTKRMYILNGHARELLPDVEDPFWGVFTKVLKKNA
nr:AIR synthase-related protein [Candidatus Sigynarchaeota archaeon]